MIGWIKSADVLCKDRVVVSREPKTFYIKGSGKGYKHAWGGSKEVVFANLSSYKGDKYSVNATVKVGSQIWHRGILKGKTIWMDETHLTKSTTINTNYMLTLEQALAIQMKASPQTDKYQQYVSSAYVKYDKAGKVYYVDGDILNVRKGPGTSYAVVGQVYRGEHLSIKRTVNGWYELYWVEAQPTDVTYYLDPDNFVNDSKQKFQFLDLSKNSGVPVGVFNDYLKDKGIFTSLGQAFVDAGKLYGVNDVYLLSHALLETGNGSSTLANGVLYKGKTVYNMYGIGAYDSCPIECGANKAYQEGWTTPYKAIVGGAGFIGNEYIRGENKENRILNTLYKMRWNPGAMEQTGRFGKQYATDIGWASKQITTMYNLYQQLGSYTLYLDVPVYKK
ncbi:glucosaminidase domain-containing protein [Virgibacillus halophilus]|uniref:Glucosaminidase domain-containing protein n=1 Tax=Tigheibacillus halophilus TaxID=361280 RepID=A0ABU5C4C9_9BACI|nr:glucosaminidase domain-containing protein [Virgibacillus halophilus]